MDLQLQGRTALVSGSTAGIGRAIAERLAREGARVVLNGRSPQRVAAAVRAVEQAVPDAELLGVVADLGGEAGVRALLRQVADVDVLVSNVGIGRLARERGVEPQAMRAAFFATARPTSPLRRFIDPAEVATLVAYLASPLAAATTGAALRADGGVLTQI